MHARLHYAALHDREDKGGERFQIYINRKTRAGVLENFFKGGDPAIEIRRDALLNVSLFFGDFHGKLADEATVGVFSIEQIFAINIQNPENPIDGVRALQQHGVHDDGHVRFEVEVQDGKEQLFLGLNRK